MKGRILIIDDNKGIRDFLSVVLERDGYEVFTSENGEKGMEILAREGADVIITDLHMPRMDGLQTLKEAKKISPDIIVIMITVDKSVRKAVEAIKEGAYDYLTKDEEGHLDADQIKLLVQRGLEELRLKEENVYLRDELKKRSNFSNIIGNSPQIREVLEVVKRVADIDSNVLLVGESGTGKELIAQAIHYSGKRAQYPFVTINCSALPETLLESELFGHEKGAYTGASTFKKGLLEVADRGTVFLDEIGEMPLSIQSKVLRVIEEKEFFRVGGTKSIKVDVRLVVATNKNLEELVKGGRFREDLYYRLNVIPIYLPPLREKKEDIPLLCRHFIEKYNKVLHKKIKNIEENAIKALMEYSWPGNVRELENFIERTVALIDEKKEEITLSDLPYEFQTGIYKNEGLNFQELRPGCAVNFKKLVSDFEKRIISEALMKTKKKKEAANLLNLSPRILRYLMKKYGLGNEDKSC